MFECVSNLTTPLAHTASRIYYDDLNFVSLLNAHFRFVVTRTLSLFSSLSPKTKPFFFSVLRSDDVIQSVGFVRGKPQSTASSSSPLLFYYRCYKTAAFSLRRVHERRAVVVRDVFSLKSSFFRPEREREREREREKRTIDYSAQTSSSFVFLKRNKHAVATSFTTSAG